MSKAWTPRYHHVSQWGSAGNPNNGGNNCGECSAARAIMEYDPLAAGRDKNPKWDLVREIHDPNKPQTIQALINQLAQIGRGYPNGPANGATSMEGMLAIFQAFDLDATLQLVEAAGVQAVMRTIIGTPMLVLWVDGDSLYPSSYSGEFFGEKGPDHFILSLPDGNLMNDPLSNLPDQKTDVRYAWDAISGAVAGVITLPRPENLAHSAKVTSAVEIKKFPNHLCGAVAKAKAGDIYPLSPAVTPHWQEVFYTAGGVTGWLLKSDIEYL